MSNSISQNIWKSSKCQCNEFYLFKRRKLIYQLILDCLDIVWDFPKMNSTAELNTRTLKFKTFLLGWRSCVEFLALNDTQICSECSEKFDSLFDYYWKIYTDKDVDFCIDIESVVSTTITVLIIKMS